MAGRPITPERLAEAVHLYVDEKLPAVEIIRRTGLTSSTIAAAVTAAGHPLRGNGRYPKGSTGNTDGTRSTA